MEPPPKRQRLDDAGAGSASRPYTHNNSDQRSHEMQNWFTGQGIQNSEGRIGVARDININNYGSAAHEHGEHDDPRERRRALLDSLRFDQMDTRQMSIKKAHSRTCRWFMKDPEYLQWSKNDGTQSHGGFLWIKGKPGAGKSTLMKFLLGQTLRTRSEGIIISFFFNARGEDMEKTTLGLYRSLLVQLLEVRPSLQSILDRVRNGHPHWSLELLEGLFEEAVEGLGETSLVCFIDALDECHEQEVRNMIRFLSELSDTRSRFNVCFASRHYPHITIPKGRSIVLEDKDEHREDIAKYLDNALRIGSGKVSEQIRSDLQEKASGVFMWVVLVVDILNKECDRGQKHTLRSRLRQIPGDLHALFREILTRDTHNASGLLLCIQWVLFSRQPLSPRQLYYAILAGVEPENLADCHTDDITNDDISKFVLDKSKGLAESTKSKLPTIQFIHESVRDFLLKDKGLEAIWPGVSANLEGHSHDALKRACFAYMTCQHISHAIDSLEIPLQSSRKEDTDRRADIGARFPFLEYATESVLYHADKAEQDAQSQTEFLTTFPIAEWVTCHNLFEQHQVRRFTPDVSLLYILAHDDHGALISIQKEDRPCFRVERERYGTPLFAALSLKRTSAVKALLECQKKRQIPDPLLSNFDVPTSPEDDWFTFFSRDFRFSGKEGVLSHLDKAQFQKLIDIFCSTEVVDPCLRDVQGRFPLAYAARGTNVELAKLLLERGADVNGTDFTIGGQDRGKTPLHYAVERGTTEMIELLVERGARLDAVDGDGFTLLHYASRRGNGKIVKFLPKDGAKAESSNNAGITPYRYAASGGHIEFARLLLDKGANVKAVSHNGSAPISLASGSGHWEMVKLLIERGADVHTSDSNGWTPLHYASSEGRIEIGRLLLDKGADIHATTGYGSKPISLASQSGHLEMVKLLIERGADVIHTSGPSGWAPLHNASYRGHTEVVGLLIDKGADVHVAAWDRFTSLHGASSGGHIETVELLIAKGADVDAAEEDGWTPLHWATHQGHVKIVRILLEKGANIEAWSNNRKTPLDRAVDAGHEEVVKLLKEWGASSVSDRFHQVAWGT